MKQIKLLIAIILVTLAAFSNAQSVARGDTLFLKGAALGLGPLAPNCNSYDECTSLRDKYKAFIDANADQDMSNTTYQSYFSALANLNLEVKRFDDQKKSEDKAAAEFAKRPKLVRIGMTKQQVLATQWGNPNSVNTTTNRYGTREQWVYGGRNYLYFENGVLTTIQN